MHIFISYSKTRERVASLAQDLEALGHTVWFDQALVGGQDWWDNILANVRACDLFIFALAPTSLDSYPCQLEYTYAAALNKRILPVLLEDVNTALLPPVLSRLQFVDYRAQDRKAAFALMSALGALPPAAPLPEPLPEPPAAPISAIGRLGERVRDPAPLGLAEQSAAFIELKGMLDGKEQGAAREVLHALRARPDLLASVAREVDDVLRSTSAPVAVAASTGPVAIAPPRSRQADYLETVRKRLTAAGFSAVPYGALQRGQMAVHAAYVRRRTSLKRLGIEDTVVVVASAGDLTEAAVTTFTRRVTEFGPKAKGGLPMGYGRAITAYAIILAERVDPAVSTYVTSQFRGDEVTGAIEFPVLVELSSETLVYPLPGLRWAQLYAEDIAREALALFAPGRAGEPGQPLEDAGGG